MAGKKGMKPYSREVELEAVRLFYAEGKTRAQITEQLGILDRDRVKNRLRQYRQGGAAAFTQQPRRPGPRPKKGNEDA